MHWIEEWRRENDRLHLIQAMVLLFMLGRNQRQDACSTLRQLSQITSKRYDQRSEGATFYFPNSLFVGSFLPGSINLAHSINEDGVLATCK